MRRAQRERSYLPTRGRTQADRPLHLEALVIGTPGHAPGSDQPPEALRLYQLTAVRPLAIAELAVRLGLSPAVVRVLVSDLVEDGRVVIGRTTPDRAVLQRMRDGLRRPA